MSDINELFLEFGFRAFPKPDSFGSFVLLEIFSVLQHSNVKYVALKNNKIWERNFHPHPILSNLN